MHPHGGVRSGHGVALALAQKQANVGHHGVGMDRRAMPQFSQAAANTGLPLQRVTAEDKAAMVHGGRSVVASMQDNRRGFEASGSLIQNVPPMEMQLKYERSWSIQTALDQHAALAEQREVLAEIGRNRLRIRQTQLSFAELEAEDSHKAASSMSPSIAGDAERVLQVASRVRAAVRDLRLVVRLLQMERSTVEKVIALSEEQIEKSREEMTCMKEVIDDKSLCLATDDGQPAPKQPVDANGNPLKQRYRYCTNCKVGGHGQRFCEYLLERPDWRVYPHQKWFEDEKKNEYHCPLGKKLVDFADESHFSRISMYLKGRAWLEEKTKILEIGYDKMPDTFIIEKGQWIEGKAPPSDNEVNNMPWFVKEADRNWGTSVHVCSKPSECMKLVKPDATYVVQQHIKDPLLMSDGRKCHIKFYVLLVGLEDGVRWNLYTFKEGYLSISPNAWSPEDTSKETQVTIIRTERIGSWEAWPDAYPKCKASVAVVIERAVKQGKLEGRFGKKQFEIFSADFIVDTNGGVWLFEFNMSPVLKDPKDSPHVHDADMIRGALAIVEPWDGYNEGNWDFAGEFFGEEPKPKAQEQQTAPPSQLAAPSVSDEASSN